MNEGWLWLSILKTTASPSPMSMTPAFSPGPQITRGPLVGSVRSQIFDDLYEQCSLHIAAMMPVSVRFGVRPRIAQARSNSSRLRPSSAASSAVTLLPIMLFRERGRLARMRPGRPRSDRDVGASLQRAHQAVEKRAAVGSAEQRVGRVLGMRHQAEDRAAVVEDAGDGAGRAVEIVRLGEHARGPAIAECDKAAIFQPVEGRRIGGIAAIMVRHRDAYGLAGGVAAGKDRLAVFDAQMDVAAGEGERAVRQQRAWQHAGLGQDLKAVADAQDRGPAFGAGLHFAHDRRPRG